ncbi:MAG TPA: hypothetical protein VEA99_11155 [Gemmatimonadaceae bacterium]|nr:hypothetical protein [Gemmatimonadaceae bacterium]
MRPLPRSRVLRMRSCLPVLALALLLAQGCAGITGGCTYRIRSAAAVATTTVDGRTVAVDALFFQVSDGSVPTAFEVGFGDSPLLSGTVTLTLADSRRPSEALVRANVPAAELVANRRFISPVGDASTADRIFDAMASGAAILTVHASGGGQPIANLTLVPRQVQGWTRPRCD